MIINFSYFFNLLNKLNDSEENDYEQLKEEVEFDNFLDKLNDIRKMYSFLILFKIRILIVFI